MCIAIISKKVVLQKKSITLIEKSLNLEPELIVTIFISSTVIASENEIPE